MFSNSKWIWSNAQAEKNERANFFFDVYLDRVPEIALLNIGCETRYWLFVNGELTVFDGGLFRESNKGCGYFEKVDIAKYLRSGKNEITVHVWYYGNGGRNNSCCKNGGLILSCAELGIFSTKETLCCTDTAYYIPTTEPTSHLYGGDHTAFDANVHSFSLCPSRLGAQKAVELGEYGCAPFGALIERPVPMLYFSKRHSCSYEVFGSKYIVKLPYAMQLTPYFKVEASGGELIDVRTDRFEVHGGPGDTQNIYRGHKAEYVCKSGEQEF